MHLHKKLFYRYFESQSNWGQKIRNKSIAEVMETSDAAEEANQSKEEPEIVTDEDENRKIAAEALTLQAPNAEQMTLKNQKQSDIRRFSNIFYLYCLLVSCEKKKSFILISVVFFCPKIPKLCIADTWL